MKLYIGNLPRSVNDEQLLELVKAFGEPDSARVIMDRGTGESRGFGFVEFNNANDARAAINGLNGKEVGGRTLVVNEAREQKGGGRGGGGSRGGGGRRGW